MGFSYDQNKTYTENIKEILRKDASVWGKVYIPDGVEKAKENRVHRMLEGLNVWED